MQGIITNEKLLGGEFRARVSLTSAEGNAGTAAMADKRRTMRRRIPRGRDREN